MSPALRKWSAVLFLVTVASGVAYGIHSAIQSPLFLIRAVEVSRLKSGAPLDARQITGLAGVPLGSVNLFGLDLAVVEKRILASPWVREVRLVKRLPGTLAIAVTFREPQALVQEPGGELGYVDADGQVFGRVNLLTRADLPILTGFLPGAGQPPGEDSSHRMADALRLIDGWERSPLESVCRISSLSWDARRGYHAIVYYPAESSGARARAAIDFGREIESSPEDQFRRLYSVIRYLDAHSIAATRIWADSGKKVVVRSSHGS